MVWAAMGWDWKSELVLLERLEVARRKSVILPILIRFWKQLLGLNMPL
jgi:hypothetical protein